MKKRFYVIRHIDDKFSIQASPFGGAELLTVEFDPKNEQLAIQLCDAANAALKSVDLLADPQ
jgi:hypothetical protein